MSASLCAPGRKPINAVEHIRALPGAPLHDAADVTNLQSGGVDAIMVGNESDRPHVFKAAQAGIAAKAALIQPVTPKLRMPFGVNDLWDPAASVAIGAVTGASFVCEPVAGLFASGISL